MQRPPPFPPSKPTAKPPLPQRGGGILPRRNKGFASPSSGSPPPPIPSRRPKKQVRHGAPLPPVASRTLPAKKLGGSGVRGMGGGHRQFSPATPSPPVTRGAPPRLPAAGAIRGPMPPRSKPSPPHSKPSPPKSGGRFSPKNPSSFPPSSFPRGAPPIPKGPAPVPRFPVGVPPGPPGASPPKLLASSTD